MVIATACQTVAETGEPLSRQSLQDLTNRVNRLLPHPMSKSTVWRILDEQAIKPWRYEHWIFPRDPQFCKKAARVLDLYAGIWRGKPLDPKDYVLSCDEKTSIQARQRIHPGTPTKPGQSRRVEPEYIRRGALQYFAAWDVRQGIVTGRCEPKTGIAPFSRLADQILANSQYAKAKRIFVVVDNGSSHRGQASIDRLKKRDKRLILVHTPVHASWLNQVEIYFSMVQRKVLTPNDFASLKDLELRLQLYEELCNRSPKAFEWKFTRKKLENWLKRVQPHLAKVQTPGDSLD
ncbi:MAG: IS630 family transposase [Fimbriiglobus sp.]